MKNVQELPAGEAPEVLDIEDPVSELVEAALGG
jgi:hypothetical protein